MKRIVIVALVLIVANALVAKPLPQVPAPQPGSARLGVLVGSWSGEAETMESGKAPSKSRVTIDCREASGGWAVRCNAAFVSPEMKYLETDLFGYDAVTGKVHMYSVTNAGEVHDHAGTWEDPARLTVEHRGPSSGGDLIEAIKLNFEGKNALAFDVVTTVAGSTAATMRGRLTRQR